LDIVAILLRQIALNLQAWIWNIERLARPQSLGGEGINIDKIASNQLDFGAATPSEIDRSWAAKLDPMAEADLPPIFWVGPVTDAELSPLEIDPELFASPL